MTDIVLVNAIAYAARHHLRLTERLGFGTHGTVHVAEHESNHECRLRLGARSCRPIAMVISIG